MKRTTHAHAHCFVCDWGGQLDSLAEVDRRAERHTKTTQHGTGVSMHWADQCDHSAHAALQRERLGEDYSI